MYKEKMWDLCSPSQITQCKQLGIQPRERLGLSLLAQHRKQLEMNKPLVVPIYTEVILRSQHPVTPFPTLCNEHALPCKASRHLGKRKYCYLHI